ncbi:MAG: gfo/Idh/MocA family oxidoreductase [Chlorobi bacterium]|nr:MAG: Gfo/Idh/MocA family oxidoreductase [Bacteroidota bacterium]KXK32600.1 MAG: dehydrogenase [Chlorobi bacterium OLB6]MBE2265500.1 Gfo/Idh/MocA family oxidoreductase [Flavobacteriales bacterium]MBL1161992.1 gfo/Idh/MocA family oxidoreductase [Chlorobiota bacterium]MBW7854437.1 Gfo/Idh/MocA family oxidoreductase [Candidatus Kapabacteria bacterium]MCC6331707.1 Gfo/Idh/MocA family oxidoreductase [Ignavibacteria bacterium]
MVNVILVGAGNIAQSIHLPVLTEMPKVKVQAIVDRQIAKAKLVAEKHAIPYAFRSLTEALKLPDIHGVVITSSTDAHCEHALESIAAGKAVFIERPAARTMDETVQIKMAADAAGTMVMVGMNHRFRQDVAMMKNAIDRGEIGKLFYIKAGWVKQRSNDSRWMASSDKSGGGVLMDLGVSVVDLILHVLDFSKVRSVTASTFNQETKAVEDIAIAMLQFQDGAVATIEASWSLMRTEDLYYCNVFGKKGSVYMNPFKLVKKDGATFSTTHPAPTRHQQSLYRKSYEAELRHFVSAIQGIIPPVSSISDAVERMRIIDALYASASLNREIVIP